MAHPWYIRGVLHGMPWCAPWYAMACPTNNNVKHELTVDVF